MTISVRRVVTGKDADGKAVASIDGLAGNVISRRRGHSSALLWTTDETPADISGDEDAGDRTVPRPPPPTGSIFRIAEFEPGCDTEMHYTDSVDYAVIVSGEIDMALDDSVVHLRAGDVVVQRGTNHNWINRGDVPCVVAFVLIGATG